MPASVKVCICSNRHASPMFAPSLAMLMVDMAKAQMYFSKVGIAHLPWQSCLPLGREQCVKLCIETGYSHILFIDDDSIVPPDAGRRLFKSGKRIIGANFVRKQFPLSFVARGLNGQNISSFKKSGVEEVGRIGFGLTLINLDVFKKMERPWMAFGWDTERGHLTEDTVFCDKAKALGETLWIDHSLSNEVKHAGEYLYAADSIDGQPSQ